MACRSRRKKAREETTKKLVRLDELSAASSALVASPFAPLSEATLAELCDPERRPSEPYGDIGSALLHFQPESPERLPPGLLLANLRRARKGAGAGPAGLTAECCPVVLGDERTSQLFVKVAQALAQAQVPPAVAAAFGLGRVVAFQKPNGRVRGTVVSDFLRRLVARSFAQHSAATLQEACAPFQFGLSTRAGAEAVAHALSFATEFDPDATVLSVDGIGTFDTVSRQARHVPGTNAMLPFVRQFYASRSRFVWHDAQGAPHMIFQAEGARRRFAPSDAGHQARPRAAPSHGRSAERHRA